MRSRVVILAAAVLLAAGCGGRKQAREVPVEAPLTREFRTVKVPVMVSDDGERLSYIGANFWNAFFADTTAGYLCDSLHIAGVDSEVFEEQVGMFSSVVAELRKDEARKDLVTLFNFVTRAQRRDTASNIFGRTNELIEKYLYNPNSPVRDEDIYGAWAERLSQSEFVSEGMRMAYARDARMCALNSVGTKAADFGFTDRDGRRHTLYGIQAPVTLLFFSNPGCTACGEIISALKADGKVAQMVRSGFLAVVNVYIDEDTDAWRAYADNYPESWYNGYDQSGTIRQDIAYNVRAIPSLYLLDGDKTVVMKDAPAEKVLAWLDSLDY